MSLNRPRIVVIRHGETGVERRSSSHRTHRPPAHRAGAGTRALAPLLSHLDQPAVWSSPLRRARETAAAAGLTVDRLDDRLMEWDYGEAEGRTTAELREETPGWSVWTHEIVGGESLDDVAARADSVLGDLQLLEGDVVVFAHAHLLRVLAVRWCRWPASAAQSLMAEPASIGVLHWERDTPAIRHWNAATGHLF